MSKMISPHPYECTNCLAVKNDGTVTLNSHHLWALVLPHGWGIKLVDSSSGHQMVRFVCADCKSKGVTP